MPWGSLTQSKSQELCGQGFPVLAAMCSPCPEAVAVAGALWAGLSCAGRNVPPPVRARLHQRPAGPWRGRHSRAEAAESSGPAGPAGDGQGTAGPAAAPGRPSAVCPCPQGRSRGGAGAGAGHSGSSPCPGPQPQPLPARPQQEPLASEAAALPREEAPAPRTSWSSAARGAAGPAKGSAGPGEGDEALCVPRWASSALPAFAFSPLALFPSALILGQGSPESFSGLQEKLP